ncbi:hypothetical protein ACFL0G_01670 [Candidatus Zixiibacteriota bacterium]
MSYQGTLTDEYGVALDTTVDMTFSIHTDSTGGSQVWTETQSAVAINSGIFNVLLGRVNAILDTVFKDPSRWLGVQVGGDAELQPRQRITAVGYALHSAAGGSDGDWIIDGDNLYRLDGNVGIGSDNPSAKLDIIGNTRVRGKLWIDQLDSTESVLNIYNWDLSDWELVAASDADRFDIREYGSSPSLSLEAGGNVGIGTATPAAHLHVASQGNTELRIGHDDWKNTLSFYAGATSKGYLLKDDDAGRLNISADGSSDHVTVLESNGNVGIGTIAPSAKLDVQGTLNVGEDDTGYDVNFYGASTGSRFFWDGDKGALRAGKDSDGTHWAPDSTGEYSLATGFDTKASGLASTAMGIGTTASGAYSTAMGYITTSSREASIAMGMYATASGNYSTAIGHYTNASGSYSTSIGQLVNADASHAIVLGKGIDLGNSLVNNIPNSLMVGFDDTTATLFVGGADKRVGIGTENPARKLHIDDVMRLEPRDTAPSIPSPGDIYIDSSDHNKLKVWDGTIWQACW